MRDKALSVAGVHPDTIAADIGCGTGFITEGPIQRGLKVIAVDGSLAMLSEMKRKFAGLDMIDTGRKMPVHCPSRTRLWTMLSPICIAPR